MELSTENGGHLIIIQMFSLEDFLKFHGNLNRCSTLDKNILISMLMRHTYSNMSFALQNIPGLTNVIRHVVEY